MHTAIRYSLALLFAAFPINVALASSCGPNTHTNGITLEYSQIDRSTTNSTPAFSFDSIASTANWRSQHWHAGHQYLAFGFPANTLNAPATNGDLHTLVLARSDHLDLNIIDTLTWELAPTLAVSSNQLKHTDHLQASGLYLAGELAWKKKFSDQHFSLLGICFDTLTGEYEPTPVFGYGYSGPRLNVLAGFPLSQLSFKPESSITLQLSWSIAGGNWEILDGNLENRSNFSYSSKQVRTVILYELTPSMGLHASWTLLYDQEFDYLAQNNVQMTVKNEHTNSFSLGISLTF